jgi:manganese/iron transport system permease protein/iron/zinc/copper transport system permease protein
MSYIGHGLSHAIFGGFAASALLGVNFFLGAGAWGFASAMLINGVTRRRSIGADAAIGVITTASFAIGVALIKYFGSGGKNPDALLFGQILGVNDTDVLLVAAVTLATTLVVFFGYRPLLFSTFDPEVADVSGVRTARVDALLTLVLAAAILTTMNVLGVTLVAATLVIPAVVARMLTDSFARMLPLATGIGAVCGFVGMILSYHLDIPSGPMIVLTGSTLFAAVFTVTGVRGRRRSAGLDEHAVT